MQKFNVAGLAIVVLFALCVPAAVAGEHDQAITARLGIPTDVLMNMSDTGTFNLYVYGLGIEGAYGFQLNNWLILGGVAGYGFGKTEPGAEDDYQHYAWTAVRLGFGQLAGFSGSLIGGIVYIPDSDHLIIPDIGLSLDWKFLSLSLSTGSLSAGATLNF